MAKKQQNPAPSPNPLHVFDPIALVNVLDLHFDDAGGPNGSRYRALYRQLLAAFLHEEERDAENLWALIDKLDAFTGVETAIRRAGFVQGFGACRDLITGKLNIPTLPQGGVK